MMSQKEQAARLRAQLKEEEQERVEISVIDKAKEELREERQVIQEHMQSLVAEKGYLISVPDTEVILYEDEGYQLLYCNNIDSPAKVTYLMALKQAARKLTGRTPITSQGYVAVQLPRDQFNLILASHQRHAKLIRQYQKRLDELEKEMAPLRYIQHLIKKHNIDTQD